MDRRERGFGVGVAIGLAGVPPVVPVVLGLLELVGGEVPVAGFAVFDVLELPAGLPTGEPAGDPPVLAGVEVEAGKVVIGVGGSGSGLARMPATNSFKPASDPFRNL